MGEFLSILSETISNASTTFLSCMYILKHKSAPLCVCRGPHIGSLDDLLLTAIEIHDIVSHLHNPVCQDCWAQIKLAMSTIVMPSADL